MARRGMAVFGEATQGRLVDLQKTTIRGLARLGEARYGEAWQCKVVSL